MVCAGRALAADGDWLTYTAASRVTHDDNVFRLSRGADPETAIGAASAADTFLTLSFGLSADIPAGRQRFLASWLSSRDRHERFTDLDLTGHDGRVAWYWQIGDRLSGQLALVETRALAPFTEIQARQPDLLTTRQASGVMNYALTPRWALRAAATGLEQRNGDPARKPSDVDLADAEIDLGYTTPAQDMAGLQFRQERGRFPNFPAGVGGVPSNAYRQYAAGAQAVWIATGATRADLRFDRVNRRYDEASSRDFSGNTYRISLQWVATAKTRLEAIVQRDISAYEDIRSNFVLLRGPTLRATYQASEKIELQLSQVLSDRKYLGDPAQGLVGGPRRSDRLRSSAGTLVYRPTRTVALKASAQRDARTSNLAGADYRYTVSSLGVEIAF